MSKNTNLSRRSRVRLYARCFDVTGRKEKAQRKSTKDTDNFLSR
jgi:hypothetical protein